MSDRPKFSIIIPTRDRPSQLAICLESIVHQTYPSPYFEVIVIDDGSKTPIGPVLSKFHDRLNLTLLTQQNRGPASARNTGAAKAMGQYLAFTNDDCAPAPDWLQKLEERFDSSSDFLIGGGFVDTVGFMPPKSLFIIGTIGAQEHSGSSILVMDAGLHVFIKGVLSVQQKAFDWNHHRFISIGYFIRFGKVKVDGHSLLLPCCS